MDPLHESSCPYPLSAGTGYKAIFKEAPRQNWFEKLGFFAIEFLSRLSIKSIKNAWGVGKENDLSRTFARAWKKGSFVSKCPMPIGTVYVTADTTVMRAIFQNPRASNEGLFLDHENKRLFVKGILNDIYPDEIKRHGIDKVSEMVVFTAPYPDVKLLRSPMMEVLGSTYIKEFMPRLNNIADDILESLSESEKNHCNAEELSFEFAITVLSKLMTGYITTRKNYQLLANAMNAFSKRLTRMVSHRPATKLEEIEFQSAIITIKEVIDRNVHSNKPTPFILNLKKLGWDDFKIRISLIFIYFAATETTSSSINYLLWQLGKSENKHYVGELKNPENGEVFLSKLIAETLRLHPPAFIEGRQFRKDTLLEIQDSNNKIIKKIKLRKKHSILCLTQVAALDPSQYHEPELFNPYRFENIQSQLPWYPFGAGNHVCPGQYLAHAELRVFISRIINKFDIQTIHPKDKTQQNGYFTLRATPAFIKFSNLSNS